MTLAPGPPEPVFPRLVRLYERRGIQVMSSITPLLWIKLATDKTRALVEPPNDRLFTYLIANGELCSAGGGLHMTEVHLLECLARRLAPRRIFIIGNAYGWSTLAMALAFPNASVVAIDGGQAPGGAAGIEWTNRIAREEGLKVCVVAASSPGDVAAVAHDYLGGGVRPG